MIFAGLNGQSKQFRWPGGATAPLIPSTDAYGPD